MLEENLSRYPVEGRFVIPTREMVFYGVQGASDVMMAVRESEKARIKKGIHFSGQESLLREIDKTLKELQELTNYLFPPKEYTGPVMNEKGRLCRTYQDYANQDYRAFRTLSVQKEPLSAAPYLGGQCCEKAIKHLMLQEEPYFRVSTSEINMTDTHRIETLESLVKKANLELGIEWDKIKTIDDYYLKTKYPSRGSFLPESSDIKRCGRAVEAIQMGLRNYYLRQVQEIDDALSFGKHQEENEKKQKQEAYNKKQQTRRKSNQNQKTPKKKRR